MAASLMAFASIATETVELTQTIRQDMEINRNCNDRQRIRFLISEGREKLKGLDEMLDMQGHC